MKPFILYMMLTILGGHAAALLCPAGKFGHDCESTCHCSRNANCDVTSGKCANGCADGWSGQTCQRENIAYQQKADQKDGAHYPDALNAIDGDVVTCSSTKRGEPGWWSVTLSHVRRIERIKLLTNTSGSIHGWHIYAGMEEKLHSMTLCNTGRVRDPGATITCDRPILGDHVMIVNRVGPVILCDAQVYVCSHYWYGEDCDNMCNCADSAEVCDSDSGACATGCSPGWTGTGCRSVCDGYYGPDCMYKCGFCVGDTQCDHVTGFCLSGCDAGWGGPRCRDACSNATYGPDCTFRCGHCRGQVACEQTNGACPVGCQAGWKGDKCVSACDRGTYGENCQFTCGNCASNKPCDPQTGACADSCADGYEGVFCTQKCVLGKYGPGCTKTCDQCRHRNCDHVTGACREGCPPGRTGQGCGRACPDGFHGRDCRDKCGACKPGTTCNQYNGNCPDGCADDYSGDTCANSEAGESNTSASEADPFSDVDGPQLKMFLGTTLSVVFGLMAAVIFCLLIVWHREPLLEKEKPEVTSDAHEIYFRRQSRGRSREEDEITDYV